MRCPVEVNEMLTQTPHFLLTIVLTFVIAALLALRQESNPFLKIDTVPSAFYGRERQAYHVQAAGPSQTKLRCDASRHFSAASKGTPSGTGYHHEAQGESQMQKTESGKTPFMWNVHKDTL